MIKKIVLTLLYTSAMHTSFIIRSIYDLMDKDVNIAYYNCHDSISFHFKQFPLAVENEKYHPAQGVLDQAGVFVIKNGKACSKYGQVYVDNYLIQEFLPTNYPEKYHQGLMSNLNVSKLIPQRIQGKVAVLARLDYNCYGHWIGEFLGRLALLQKHNIEYDWLYVSYDMPYIKDTLTLLGVDPNKIIQPYDSYFYIQADELIVPSLTGRLLPTEKNTAHSFTLYCPEWNINWLRKTFIPMALERISEHTFSDKVFISRKDSNKRQIINEDEVFSHFEKVGFKRYCLSEMSFLEQVRLFEQATYVVGAHGSGFINSIFCHTNTHILEIFQNRFDTTFWYISQILQLQYDCIATIEKQGGNGHINTEVSVDLIKNYIERYFSSSLDIFIA